MSLFSIFKRNSRLALRGNWGRAILILLISAGASFLLLGIQGMVTNFFVDPMTLDPTFAMRYGFNEYFFQRFVSASLKELLIGVIFLVIHMLLFSPLNLGVNRWFYQLVHGCGHSVAELFRYFESGGSYRRALWLEVNLTVRIYLWAIVFFAVPGALFGFSFVGVVRGEAAGRVAMTVASVGLFLACVLGILAFVFYGALVSRYQLAAYLLSENDEITVREAIRLSVAYTRGSRFSLFGFQLTFIGWMLLCVFFFPVFYVVPYFHTALAMYGRYLIEKARQLSPAPAPQEPISDATREFDGPRTGVSGPDPERDAPPAAPEAPASPEGGPLGPGAAALDDPAMELGERFAFPPSRYPAGPQQAGPPPLPETELLPEEGAGGEGRS